MIDRREDEQIVRAHRLGKLGRGEVLVDDGGDALIIAVLVADDGDAPTAAGDDDILIVEQVQD